MRQTEYKEAVEWFRRTKPGANLMAIGDRGMEFIRCCFRAAIREVDKARDELGAMHKELSDMSTFIKKRRLVDEFEKWREKQDGKE